MSVQLNQAKHFTNLELKFTAPYILSTSLFLGLVFCRGQLSKICQDLGPLFPVEIVTSVKNEAEFLGSLSKNHNFYWMSKLVVAEKIDLLIHLSRYFLWFFLCS